MKCSMWAEDVVLGFVSLYHTRKAMVYSYLAARWCIRQVVDY